jgi:hypothetical protein
MIIIIIFYFVLPFELDFDSISNTDDEPEKKEKKERKEKKEKKERKEKKEKKTSLRVSNPPSPSPSSSKYYLLL